MGAFLGHGPPAGELSRRLADDIERVAEAVLADCERRGSELRGHGQDGALWVVETRGRKRGVALCAADPDRSGDALSLVARAACGGDYRAAYAWARRWLGEGPAAEQAGAAAPRDALPKLPPADDAEADALRRRRAMYRFLSAHQNITGTPVEAYLAGRGLKRDLVPLSGALRYSESCYYGGGYPGQYWPAMVAAVIDPATRQFLAAHCTYLEHSEKTGWRKARLMPPRKVWGRFRGGVIPLLRGASGKSLKYAPDGDGCLIAEGIENALSASFLRPELRAFAAVAVGNLSAIALPPAIASVLLVCDRDGENDGVRVALDRAVTRWLNEGRGVELMRPPGGYADMNDWLQASLAADAPLAQEGATA